MLILQFIIMIRTIIIIVMCFILYICNMIRRNIEKSLQYSLKHFPVVILLGPRQVGKTTLAKLLAKSVKKASLYFDMELNKDKVMFFGLGALSVIAVMLIMKFIIPVLIVAALYLIYKYHGKK